MYMYLPYTYMLGGCSILRVYEDYNFDSDQSNDTPPPCNTLSLTLGDDVSCVFSKPWGGHTAERV